MNKIVLILTFGMLLASCGDSANSPKGVAGKFLMLVSKGEFEKAKELGTPQTAMLLDISRGGDLPEKVKILRDSVVGDHALVFYFNERTQREESIDLIKRNDKWKVDLRMRK